MATTYYVYSGAAGTNAGTSWTNAYTAFASAITAASTAGDIILVHYTHQEELASDTTYTFGANINVISVDKDNSDAPTVMGTGGWIGNSTTNRSVTFAGNDRQCLIYGITIRTAGSTVDNIILGNSVGQAAVWESCYFWSGNAAATAQIQLISAGGYAEFIGCTFRFGHASQQIVLGGNARLVGCSVSADGTAPSGLILGGVGLLECVGCDFSVVTNTLVRDTLYGAPVTFERCRFGANVTVLAAQTSNPSKGSAKVFVSDCHSGDTHMEFGYYDALGEVTKNSSIYTTAGTAAASWKIVTSANAMFGVPFETPWIDLYNTGTSAITPYFEILRDGNNTAYTNAQVWGEFSIKTTSGYTNATTQNDRQALSAFLAGTAGGNQATGGLAAGDWTNENATAWFGKVDSGSAMTPAEVGYIRGRVCVGAASITVYVDPQIRT